MDALFLGGDVFDQNKPSRETLVQAMDVLREYVFGDDPIEFEVVSDQSINFPNRGIVNFEDENVNVALPIFAIHGNHDDPSGQENLSALDILSSCSLINYFGKHALSGSNTGAIELKPVLLRKGETKLAQRIAHCTALILPMFCLVWRIARKRKGETRFGAVWP